MNIFTSFSNAFIQAPSEPPFLKRFSDNKCSVFYSPSIRFDYLFPTSFLGGSTLIGANLGVNTTLKKIFIRTLEYELKYEKELLCIVF